MADRPILFSAPMVRALLDGRKTQTRRIIKPRGNAPSLFDGEWSDSYVLDPGNADWRARDTRFAVGDRLWVKETAWICPPFWTDSPKNPMGPERREVAYKADDRSGYTADAAADYKLKLTPSIFMPRWASRLTLTVTDVRVERLNDCTEEDALAEGVIWDDAKQGFHVPGVEHPNKDFPYLARATAREMYAALWDTINGSGEWLGNPWIVAVSFSVERRNIDAL